ncbi:hypothetical protein VN12_16640 [Pirellula sp. SH-Sr6A]|uniref:hypothetical protein n=1 Tax=Pirellula sp. SH-Sr6A TaxID=1632865 RepID=UPI00078DC521|nr:hypothetical protein [Pirellula sp. SH-Sr6A]AMV33759.1 hypothetical protein VN12_16640 [Pirellula sp. SH-Sr6A]
MAVHIGHLLAEILRLRRWASGNPQLLARAFALESGFESAFSSEEYEFSVSIDQQEAVEDFLDAIDKDPNEPNSMYVKDELRRLGLDESVAWAVLELCLLEGRFVTAIRKLTEPGMPFHGLKGGIENGSDWLGALHYLELFDGTPETHKKLHACFSPAVPRVGERIVPRNGSAMRVVDVEYQVVKEGSGNIKGMTILMPCVYLEPESDES